MRKKEMYEGRRKAKRLEEGGKNEGRQEGRKVR